MGNVCKVSDFQKFRSKRIRFEQANVFKSMRELQKAPKGYDGFVASRRATCKFGKPYYKVFPYIFEPIYSGNKLVRLRKEFFKGSTGVEWVKKKPTKKLYENNTEADFL